MPEEVVEGRYYTSEQLLELSGISCPNRGACLLFVQQNRQNIALITQNHMCVKITHCAQLNSSAGGGTQTDYCSARKYKQSTHKHTIGGRTLLSIRLFRSTHSTTLLSVPLVK